MKPFLPVTLVLLLSATGWAAEPVEYTRDVKPLFAKYCIGCHGPDKQKGDLRLDTAASIRKGGDSGPAIQAGASDSSILVIVAGGGSNAVAAIPRVTG